MSTGTIRLTPSDHGQRMAWEEYVHAEGEDGLRYELGRGVLTVIDVPNFRHGQRASAVDRQFLLHQERYPRSIRLIASGDRCRLPIPGLESDRHPDVAVYTTAPPTDVPADEFWSTWIPAIVIEVVSLSSVVRDYQEKPDEYLRFGVSEYWIVDPEKNEMLVHRRVGGQWKKMTFRPGESYRPPLLPGFEFDLAAVLAAGEDAAPAAE